MPISLISYRFAAADRLVRTSRALLPVAAACLSLMGLSACAGHSGGVRGYTAFRATAEVTEIAATVPLDAFAECFRTTATFLPLSDFSLTEKRFVYRLQLADLWFEELVVERTSEGIRGELRISGIYDAKWREILERDRLPALAACQTSAGVKSTIP